MCVSRDKYAILLVLKLSFQKFSTFKQRFGAPPPPHTAGSAGPFVTTLGE